MIQNIILAGIAGVIIGSISTFLILLFTKIKNEFHRGQKEGEKDRAVLYSQNQDLQKRLDEHLQIIGARDQKIESQKGRPDAIVHLPENRDIIIDAKVSLKAYEQLSVTNDEETQLTLIKEHVNSIRTHIKNLSSKEYQKLINIKSMDFVLLFIPIEGAIAVAIHHDPNLFGGAFDKNIILVGPSTLLATLRTIENIWKYEKQNQNAQKIAKKAGLLYDKVYRFT